MELFLQITFRSIKLLVITIIHTNIIRVPSVLSQVLEKEDHQRELNNCRHSIYIKKNPAIYLSLPISNLLCTTTNISSHNSRVTIFQNVIYGYIRERLCDEAGLTNPVMSDKEMSSLTGESSLLSLQES